MHGGRNDDDVVVVHQSKFDKKNHNSYGEKSVSLISCGLLSGIVQAVIFNPWDRALYLSIKDERPFLDRRNFVEPMRGMFQTLFQRAMSAGLYFPLEDIFREEIAVLLHPNREYRLLHNFAAGTLAGMLNAVLMNPAASVKYHYWGKADCGNENFFSTAKEMYQKGGYRPFFAGSLPTITRDIIFGGTYALLRHEMNIHVAFKNNNQTEKTNRFMANMVSACLATIFSSPWNYVRNIHYATPPEVKPQTSLEIMQSLIEQSKESTNIFSRIHYIQKRLRIGWGTARVGVGMAFGSEFYDYCSRKIKAK